MKVKPIERRVWNTRQTTSTSENVAEGISEVGIENSIQDRIESRIEVAEPEEELHGITRYTVGIGELRAHIVDEKEREPTDNKHSHDDAKRLGDTRLARAQLVVRRGRGPLELAHAPHHTSPCQY